MTDVSNMEDNMSVLLDDFLSREQIVNDEIKYRFTKWYYTSWILHR
jgi:hypothetical protein